MLMENVEFINGFLQECKKDSLDQNTLCGMIAQNITLIYKNAHSNWTHAVER